MELLLKKLKTDGKEVVVSLLFKIEELIFEVAKFNPLLDFCPVNKPDLVGNIEEPAVETCGMLFSLISVDDDERSEIYLSK
jgi:hypothetical protein